MDKIRIDNDKLIEFFGSKLNFLYEVQATFTSSTNPIEKIANELHTALQKRVTRIQLLKILISGKLQN